MGTKAYFMIKMAKRFCDENHFVGVMRELEGISEVEAVTPVSGMYDLMVRVDAPMRPIFIANKIRTRKWVDKFRILEVEAEGGTAPEVTVADLMEKK